jgi:hypothetical protein
LIGPGVVNFDGSLAKTFDVGEVAPVPHRDIHRLIIKFRRALRARIYERDWRAVSDRGPTSTATRPRQIQFD